MKPFYKCGHERDIVIINDNILSFMEYELWRESSGFDGDKSECYKCYIKRRNKEIKKFKDKSKEVLGE